MLSRLIPCIALLYAACAPAVPFTPGSGAQVIERLPTRLDQDQRRMRAALSASPSDLALATSVAQRHILIARTDADPRHLGYAQAALAPWWKLAAPPPAVRLLRATLLQATHQFERAMVDLDALVQATPGDPQAWLTRATVQIVRGDYQGARTSCARLWTLAPQLVAAACAASLAAMTGSADSGQQLLDVALARGGDTPDTAAWALTLAAELAARRGDAVAAQARFHQAIALAPTDTYLASAYADFLLEQRRHAEVADMLRRRTRVDALLLRYALALQQLPGQQAALAACKEALRARFHEAKLRGDAMHQREQARFELALSADASAALALALQNWTVQKEVADMRIVLESALKAGDAGAARPVVAWIRKHRVNDVALDRLIAQLDA